MTECTECGTEMTQKEINGREWDVCEDCNRKSTRQGSHIHEYVEVPRVADRYDALYCSSTTFITEINGKDIKFCPVCGQELGNEVTDQ